MGAGERIVLDDDQLKKIASFMSKDINDNIDKHIYESIEVHDIALTEKFLVIHKSHVAEVCAAIDIQNDVINKIQLDQIELRREMDAFKEAYPLMGMYITVAKRFKINVRRLLIWGTVIIISTLISLKIIKEWQ